MDLGKVKESKEYLDTDDLKKQLDKRAKNVNAELSDNDIIIALLTKIASNTKGIWTLLAVQELMVLIFIFLYLILR